ncbi:hypothetical protein D9M68_920270 [compost metagenome]
MMIVGHAADRIDTVLHSCIFLFFLCIQRYLRMHFFKQAETGKAGNFYGNKRNILLRSSILYGLNKFRNCFIKFSLS